ncbi:MAG: hypothetical protein C0390_03825 [Syntrophus sp. (in: bacteria)]|nr:hypothetical protein [Syntrophus sp. (in: bacteria)]
MERTGETGECGLAPPRDRPQDRRCGNGDKGAACRRGGGDLFQRSSGDERLLQKARGEQGGPGRGLVFTGDIGFIDKDGYLTLLDRKKDLILASGCVIYPREVDQALLACSKVLDACTIGIPDGHGGETIKAYVVLKPGETADVEEIIARCSERLAPDKIPQGIEFIDVLPKSAVGNILKREMRELERKKRLEKGREVPLNTDH